MEVLDSGKSHMFFINTSPLLPERIDVDRGKGEELYVHMGGGG